MPRNNGRKRREERKAQAEARAIAYANSGKSVAEREAERGFPARSKK